MQSLKTLVSQKKRGLKDDLFVYVLQRSFHSVSVQFKCSIITYIYKLWHHKTHKGNTTFNDLKTKFNPPFILIIFIRKRYGTNLTVYVCKLNKRLKRKN